MVRILGFHCRGLGSIPGRGAEILQARRCGPKEGVGVGVPFAFHSSLPSIPVHDQAPLRFSKGPAWCSEHVRWPSLNVLGSPFLAFSPPSWPPSQFCAVQSRRGVQMLPGKS